MHVALNWLFMHPRAGGVGTAAREVVPHLLAAEPGLRVTIFCGAEADPVREAAPWRDAVTWVRHGVTVTHGPPANWVRSMGTQWVRQPLGARARGCDVLHGPANSGAIVAPGVATVTTVHDLIWLAHPESMSRRDWIGTRVTTVAAARAADRVLADSAATREVLEQRLGIDPARVDVVPLGVSAPGPAADEQAVRARLRLGSAPVVLCVSQKRPHKNLEALVRALALLERPEVRLVVPGAPTEYEERLRTLAGELGVGEQLVLPDWVEADELEALYRMAHCVVLPSLEEGFGLPVLEAMVRDVPVVCSGRSALAEVAGDAALLFDPTRADAIAAATRRLLDDPRLAEELRVAGRARAAQFTWRRTAEATLDAYRRAIAQRRLVSWDRP